MTQVCPILLLLIRSRSCLSSGALLPCFSMGSQSIRASEQGLFLVLVACTTTMWNRVSLVMGPSAWNSLPLELHCFSKTLSFLFFSHLKTITAFPKRYLFCFFLTLRLSFLAMLEFGAPLSSFDMNE